MQTARAILAAILICAVALPGMANSDALRPGGTFIDDDGNVHEGYIEAIAEADITRGCNPPSNYLYCPNQAVTRGQMAAFLVRALDLPPSTSNRFSDDNSSVFENDINALAAAEVTKGCDPPANTRFCANDVVTRGQMAAFLVRAFELTEARAENRFDDDDGTVFESDIERLAATGITKGCNPPTNSRYCPEDPVRRDQMATFLGRVLKLHPIHPSPPGDLVIAEDTMVENERLVLRAGDSIEFRNGARLMIGPGASVDWQGTPTTTWSDEGRVQNLNRDVRIFGQGDIMFMSGSRPSTIRFVEIDLQPIKELGRYPLHWHHVGDGARGTLVEGVVVKNSTNRAFVPHASHGITFRDTIAKNIAGEAYWWDPPPREDRRSKENNSNDIVYDHVLADGVSNAVGDKRGFRLAAFVLGRGTNNTVRNSVARNVNPSHAKSCSGFTWPESGSGVWTFEGNRTFESRCNAIFVWQNTRASRVIDGFSGTEPIEHGAYTNHYEYRNVDVPGFVVHAVGWSVNGGKAGHIRISRHVFEGTVTFTNVSVQGVTIDNASRPGTAPGHYVFTNTGLTCAEVEVKTIVPGTSVTIDGTACNLNSG